MDYREYKRIMSLDFREDSINRSSFIQRITFLKQILDYKNINSNQSLIFCQDQLDQALYVTQPECNQITTIMMLNKNTEECYDQLENAEAFKQQAADAIRLKLRDLYKKTDAWQK